MIVAPSESFTVRGVLAQCGLVPLEAQLLLAHILGVNRAWLVAHAIDGIDAARALAFFALSRRRREGEPVAYLTGRREFWGLDLAVSRDVLIPRPETETVVETALSRLPSDRDLRVLDLGTGCGAIALAIAHERPRADVVATDRSAAALAIAHGNAQRLGIDNVSFIEADWYRGLPASERFDLVASNPPYVGEGDPHLFEGDLRHEPKAALTAGRDGLAAIRTIVAGARAHLVAGGWLVLEHGYDQQTPVRELVAAAGGAKIAGLRDLAGVPRVVAARFDPSLRGTPA